MEWLAIYFAIVLVFVIVDVLKKNRKEQVEFVNKEVMHPAEYNLRWLPEADQYVERWSDWSGLYDQPAD